MRACIKRGTVPGVTTCTCIAIQCCSIYYVCMYRDGKSSWKLWDRHFITNEMEFNPHPSLFYMYQLCITGNLWGMDDEGTRLPHAINLFGKIPKKIIIYKGEISPNPPLEILRPIAPKPTTIPRVGFHYSSVSLSIHPSDVIRDTYLAAVCRRIECHRFHTRNRMARLQDTWLLAA